MKRASAAVLLTTFLFLFGRATAAETAALPLSTLRGTGIAYGANPAAGNTFVHAGVEFYYETYGAGEPILVVHGNGGSIADLAPQIAHFREYYHVIAMDSRNQGKSGTSDDELTYEKMADDLAALIDHLQVGSVNVLGWSDGAIEALLLGIRHPAKVKKIAAMAANLSPGEEALHPEFLALARSMIDAIPPAERDTPQARREMKVTALMFDEPHIELAALATIAAPTLVMAADHDLVRDEHTVEIYHHIPNSQLVIFPDATHMVPFDDPVFFNTTVERFFRTPFEKKSRIEDTLESFGRMKQAQGKGA